MLYNSRLNFIVVMRQQRFTFEQRPQKQRISTVELTCNCYSLHAPPMTIEPWECTRTFL